MTMALILALIPLSGGAHLAMLLPLCLSIAVVYKATRCEDLRELPLSALALWGTMLLGMSAVGAGLWVLFFVMA